LRATGVKSLSGNISRTGGIRVAAVVSDERADLVATTVNGITAQVPLSSVAIHQRTAQGLLTIGLSKGDALKYIVLSICKGLVQEDTYADLLL
jgi:hypothetical protein